MGIFDSFLGEPIIGGTDNFLVTASSDTPAARAAAQAILGSAEADLGTLEGWFSYSWNDFPYGIWVSVGDDGSPGPHASNSWYGTSHSPHIEVYGATTANTMGSAAVRDELARMLFVAELAEVLMHAAPTGWNPGNSAGEALSRVAAAELHPQGYYRPAGSANNGPYATPWVQLDFRKRDIQDADNDSPRYDFITVSENTDTNNLSYGCGILFLYYLRYQLHFTWKQIASSWGAHLCETFGQLTGRPPHTAFPEFSDVLDAHLPPGTSVSLVTENVFPLSSHPPVVLVASYGKTSGKAHPVEALASLKPGPLCPEGTYAYRVVDVTAPVSVLARSPGTYAPGFTWKLNGVDLAAHGATQQVTVPVRIVDTQPGTGEPARDGVALTVRYTITDSPDRSRLDLVNLSFPGNTDGMEIRVVMSEAGRSVIPGQFVGSTIIAPRYRDYDMEWRWYSDVSRCNPRALGRAVVHHDALISRLFALKNLPDPAPDQLADLVEAATRYAAAAAELAAPAPNVTTTINQLLPAASEGLRNTDIQPEIAAGRQTFRAPARPIESQPQPRPEAPH